jgi:ribonuclease Z
MMSAYLEKTILPELEAGRPGWDKPHTLTAVHWLQEILAHSPSLDVDPLVLRIAAYAHDWGYAGLFRGGKPVGYDAGQAAKGKHMKLGAQKLERLLQDRRFISLTPAQRQRCVHLVRVHDSLEQLEATDERILMEADTLAALDVDRVAPNYGFSGNARYMRQTRQKRMSRFVTLYGKAEVERLFTRREDYYRRMCQVRFLGTGDAFSAGKRSTSSVLIHTADLNLLLEAGPAIMGQFAVAEMEAEQLEHLFVSHAHGDHVLGFPMLILKRRGAGTPLHVYGGMNTLATLATLCRLVYPTQSAERLNVRWHELSETEEDEVQLADGYVLRTAVVPYPKGVPTLAARWEWADGPSVTFVTDTVPCEATVQLARDCDLLIHEASFSETLQPDNEAAEHNHSTARKAGDVARGARCKRLALIHLGSDIGDQPDILAQEARAATGLEVIVPQDGHIERLFRSP